MSYLEITTRGIGFTMGLFHVMDVPIIRHNLGGKVKFYLGGPLITPATRRMRLKDVIPYMKLFFINSKLF